MKYQSLLVILVFSLLCACTPKATPSPISSSTFTALPLPSLTLTPTDTETPSPSVTFTPTITLTTSPTQTTTLTPTAIPSGPANVVASLPRSIACTFTGSPPACQYSYTVTYTESRGVGATITWTKISYFDTEGYSWCNGRCEWETEIRIEGNGTTTDNHWIMGIVDVIGLPDRDFRGGRVEIEYKGTDDNGYEFSGKVSSKFEKP